jgi:thioredoxin reductase (NADPH)
MCTNQQGIFACGDCRDTSLRQVITACADGAFAAHSAQEYIDGLKGVAYNQKAIDKLVN